MRSRVFAVALTMVVAAGCTTGGADAPEPDQTSSQPEVVIDWSNRPDEALALDAGFSVIACEGEGPFLCVERDGGQVGQIEYFSFDAPAGGGEDALRSHVEDDYRTFTADREGCAEGFTVSTEEPEEAEVAGGTGLRSDYSVANADGDPVERYVKYWLLDSGKVHLISAEAQEEGSCSPGEGTPFSTEALEEFESSFEIVAARSRFPEA